MTLAACLLQAPPFPGLPDLAPDESAPSFAPPSAQDCDTLLATIRAARVGGRFWEAPYRGETPPEVILRPRDASEAKVLAAEVTDGTALCVLPEGKSAATSRLLCCGEIDPWSVLPSARYLLAHGDDVWVALARIAGVTVRLLSAGMFGTPEDSADALDQKVVDALCTPMRDPFGDGWLTPPEAIALLTEWRRVIDANRGSPGQEIVAACGMSWWKREEIRRFLFVPDTPLRIASSPHRALAVAKARGGALAVWPSRVTPELIAKASVAGVPLVRVEDGFVRSAGLGSNLVPPSSVIVDRQGIHFDPSGPSDLEAILSDTVFTPELRERARALREAIVTGGISKYGGRAGEAAVPQHSGEKRIVLVPGQVENDMSVLAGGGGLTSNLELLRRVRALEPEAEIWWRPHPDVDAGHRIGAIPDEDALRHADRIVRGGSMAELLDAVDGVHVLTSLTGFEALLRGRDVTCHGTPFYAGWGLTRDVGEVPNRRQRVLALDELVAGVLLLYPRYLDPVTALPCPPEVLVARMTQGEMPNRLGWIGPLRRWQGRLMARLRAPLGKAAKARQAAGR